MMIRKIAIACTLFVASLAWGLTPGEFDALYSSPEKDAELCYKLYQAYAQGDGVEQSDSQARKWLLAAHRCGMTSARKELLQLPWRRELKKPKVKLEVAEVDDATAREKGEELVRYLMDWSGPDGNILMGNEKKLTKEQMQHVKDLIAADADLNVCLPGKSVSFHTALELACHHGELELAQLLIDYGADPCAASLLALEHALTIYSPEARDFVTSNPSYAKGKPKAPNKRQKTTSKSKKYEAVTPQEKLSVQVVDFLINNGLDVNMWTDYGWSVARLVTHGDNLLNLAQLLKVGLDVNRHQNPNECVSAVLTPERMNYLRRTGRVDYDGTPLALAISNYQELMVEELLKAGADPLVSCKEGETLMSIVERNEEDMKKPGVAPNFPKKHRRIKELMQKACAAAKRLKKISED